MNKRGPIIIIEDNIDDQHLLGEVFRRLNLGNEIIFFINGEMALNFLEGRNVRPFIIISAINSSVNTEFELRRRLKTNERLHLKCVPYLLFTSQSNKNAAIDAYSESIQGFFIKPVNMKGLTKSINAIVEYWTICSPPDIVD